MSFFSGTKRNLLALALSVGATGVAHAQVTANGCFTPVGGILGTAADVGIIGKGTNDASWNGGFGFGWETGAMGVAEFKAMATEPISASTSRGGERSPPRRWLVPRACRSASATPRPARRNG